MEPQTDLRDYLRRELFYRLPGPLEVSVTYDSRPRNRRMFGPKLDRMHIGHTNLSASSPADRSHGTKAALKS